MIPAKEFEDKYDKEFLTLLLEIQKFLFNLEKQKRLMLNSWIKVLCLPNQNLNFKKNRNLYAIKLLDNLLNKKLEPPFNKFAPETADLPKLDQIVVKSQLSNKIIEFNENEAEGNVRNFVEGEYCGVEDGGEGCWRNCYGNYLNNNCNVEPKNNNMANNKKKYIYGTNYNQINDNYSPYNNNINRPKTSKTAKVNIMSQKNNNKISNNKSVKSSYIENSKVMTNKSDQLLFKEYLGFNGELPVQNTKQRKKLNKKLSPVEKYRFESTIKLLQQENAMKTNLISQQQSELESLREKVDVLESKVNSVFKKKI